MKRIGNLWEKIISVENLMMADEKARKGKTRSYGVRLHDRNRAANIQKLHDDLAAKRFRTSNYHIFTIHEPKERKIYQLPYYPDRIVHHAVMNVMESIWVSSFTADTYSCIKNRGIHLAAKKVRRALKEDPDGTRYCLKIDIRKFYPSIDHEILKGIIRRKIKDNGGSAAESVDYSKENAGRDMAKYRQFMKNQVTELLTNYGKIDIIWFDFSFPGKNGKNRYDWDSEGLVRLAKKLQPEIIIDNRLDLADWEDGWDFATPEQSRPAGCVEVHGRKVPWETCQTFSGSWGYARDESSWKSSYQCIEQLIDAVSKGGNVIMNVGPTAKGEFDYRAIERLADYGKWLKVNGESIYGCGPAPEEFAPIPGTTLTYNPKTNRLYMHILSWRFGTFQIPFGERVKCCRLLNDGSELKFCWNTLHLPVQKPPVVIPVVEFILK